MNRDEWVDIAEVAIRTKTYDFADRGAIETAIAAVEPLIRADERERMVHLARVVPGGGIRDWAAAEAVAARLVAVICEQEADADRRVDRIILRGARMMSDLRAQIAADIEAHYTPPNGDVGPSDYDEGLHTAALVARVSCGFVDCLACARGNQ